MMFVTVADVLVSVIGVGARRGQLAKLAAEACADAHEIRNGGGELVRLGAGCTCSSRRTSRRTEATATSRGLASGSNWSLKDCPLIAKAFFRK